MFTHKENSKFCNKFQTSSSASTEINQLISLHKTKRTVSTFFHRQIISSSVWNDEDDGHNTSCLTRNYNISAIRLTWIFVNQTKHLRLTSTLRENVENKSENFESSGVFQFRSWRNFYRLSVEDVKWWTWNNLKISTFFFLTKFPLCSSNFIHQMSSFFRRFHLLPVVSFVICEIWTLK